MKEGTPLDGGRSHRFAYIMSNREKYSEMKVLFMPYLHEKKIYLNRQKINTDYFYTSYETVVPDGMETIPVTSIISINITESKMYAYSQNGLLINRINFISIIEKFGEITDISPNGQGFVLKKSLQ